jgi:hypothetical protein
MPTLTNLPIVTTATGSMIFPVVDVTTTKQLSIDTLKTFVGGASPVTSVNNKVGAVVLTATNISGFATVAISGSYTDLLNKPATFAVTTATGSVLGGVKVGSNINVTSDGTISVAAPYTLNTATSVIVGGIKIGSGISITGDGTISTVPMTTATTSVLGGVKVGSNINVTSDGTISVDLFDGGSISSSLIISDETEVTSDGVSGALLVAGGVGIGKSLIVNNTVTAASFVSTAVGVPEVYSASNLNLTAIGRVQVTQSPFKVWNVSTSTRDTITASNGDIIYNTGNNKFQGYANGVWVDLN